MVEGLTGSVCLVTGATGIAAAAARQLAARGAQVFVVALEADDCRALAESIAAAGGRCGWAAADLRDEAAGDAIARCRHEYGRIDGLFAVAGASGRRYGDGPLDEIPLSGWEATFALNGHPTFVAARAVVRHMLEQAPRPNGTRGSVVLMSSALALHPSPALFATHAYAAAKGAILSLARAMAAYYAPQGIRVNALTPGLVATPMSARAAQDPASVAYAARKQPLAGGFVPADDVAAAAVFLLSDAARSITGQILGVDGGWGVTEAAP
jgi:NAD(P)-dependent dehydrogenase (short-subunit alcohol dehydrogenase family)